MSADDNRWDFGGNAYIVRGKRVKEAADTSEYQQACSPHPGQEVSNGLAVESTAVDDTKLADGY